MAKVKIEDQRFKVDGKEISMYSGSVHYWRSKPEAWSGILDKVKDMGFNAITTYIPWEIHELQRGVFDFCEVEPSRDIDKFLTLCEEKGLYFAVRPGPQINSELTWFGFPERILEDPKLQARNAKGGKVVLTQVPRPIPALAYHSEEFLAEVDLWYDAIFSILEKHQPPKGNLVAVQVDNEMGFFFNVNPYSTDYSDSSKSLYRSFLKEKYNTIFELNKVYSSNYSAFDEIDPPGRFEGTRKEELRYYLDWIEYREFYLITSMEKLGNRMKSRGIHVPLFHNYPHPLGPGGAKGAPTTPFNLPALEEKLDFVGFDIYSKKELYDHVKTIASYVSGCSRFPYIPEFIMGVWPWYIKPGDFTDEVFVTKEALMHGIKEFNRYMVVDRNKWLGSPINRKGVVKEDSYAAHKKVGTSLMKIRWNDFDKCDDVLLMVNRDYDRLEAATTLLPVVGDFLEPVFGFSEYPSSLIVSDESLGFSRPIQQHKSTWFDAFYKALTEGGVVFSLGDTAQSVEALKKYKVLVISAFDYIGKKTADKLADYIETGGTVILGPEIPKLDDTFSSESALSKLVSSTTGKPILNSNGMEIGKKFACGKGSLIQIFELESVSSGLIEILDSVQVFRIDKGKSVADLVLYKSKTRDEYILFVANPSEKKIEIDIPLPSVPESVTDIWEEKKVEISAGRLETEVCAYDIRIFSWKAINA